jgi:thiol-disulfide isomerase/thioredoxin
LAKTYRIARRLLNKKLCGRIHLRLGEEFGNHSRVNRIIIPGEYFLEAQMKSFLLTIVFALLAISVFSLPPVAEAQAGANGDLLKPLPQMQLKDFAGKSVKQEELGGKLYVVDFWATWCGPCIVEIPSFNRLQEKYAAQGVKILGVTLASGEAKEVQPFIIRHKMKYTVVMGDDDQLGDLNIMGFPTTFIVTKDWKIYKRYIGAGSKKAEEIEADIQKLLEGQ